MGANTYWKQREEAQKNIYLKEEAVYTQEMQKIYNSMLNDVQKEIDAFYSKYADDTGISMAAAKKAASKLDMEAYSEKAKKYVANKDLSAQANAEMKLYNMTMKVNRLELLKANIGMHLVAGFSQLEGKGVLQLNERTQAELDRQAGILGKTINNPSKLANSIVNASFHNATFSQRIWAQQGLLKLELDKQLQSGLIAGKHPRVLARTIQDKFGASKYQAERLMRTELARVQIDAQMKSFERNGYEEYEFLALGSSACDMCRALDGKHFKVKDMLSGENAPPMHPNCRCSTAAYIDNKTYEDWLNAKEDGSFDGSLEEWFQKNVTERGYGQKVNLSFGTNDVDKKYLNSEEYSRKFSRITSNSRVNNALRKFAKGTLSKFGGTNTEALLVIDGKTGKELIRKTGEKNKLTVVLSEDEIEYLRNYEGEKIAIHNHPTNLYPTGSDFVAAGYRKYAFGIVATHDGRLYKYSAGSDPVPTSFMDSKIDKQTGRGYNINEPEVREGFEKALDELRKECGIKWTEIK